MQQNPNIIGTDSSIKNEMIMQENTQNFIHRIHQEKKRKALQKKKKENFIAQNVDDFIANTKKKKELFVHKKVFSILKFTQKEKLLSQACDGNYFPPEEIIELYENVIMNDGGKVPDNEQLRMIELRNDILDNDAVFHALLVNAKVWKALSEDKKAIISTILPEYYSIGETGEWFEQHNKNIHNENNPTQKKTFQSQEIIPINIANVSIAMNRHKTNQNIKKYIPLTPCSSNESLTKTWGSYWKNWTTSGLEGSKNTEYSSQLNYHIQKVIHTMEGSDEKEIQDILTSKTQRMMFEKQYGLSEDFLLAVLAQNYLNQQNTDFLHYKINGLQRFHSVGVDNNPLYSLINEKKITLSSSCKKSDRHSSIGGSSGFHMPQKIKV